MRIGIDCRLWQESTGRYIRENVVELAKFDQKNEYILFFLKKDIDKINLPKNFKKIEANVRWHTFWEQFIMPIIFYRYKLDLLHVPYFNVPIFYFKKFVVTIHDLTVLRTDTGRASTKSRLYYFIRRVGFKIALLYSTFFSAKIITVSKYVKEDIVKTLKVSPEKVVVIPNGVSSYFKIEKEDKVNEVLGKFDIKKPYLFYMGNAHPHKNIEGMIEAFEKVKREKKDLSLVIAGKKDFFVERLIDEWKGSWVFDDIYFLGYVSDQEASALYTGAKFFIYTSFSEGFGLQILESLACGTPVICSNVTSLPEIAGNAGYFFDPYDNDDITRVILKALNDDPASIKLKVKLGFERLKKFSWKKSAQKTFKIYKLV